MRRQTTSRQLKTRGSAARQSIPPAHAESSRRPLSPATGSTTPQEERTRSSQRLLSETTELPLTYGETRIILVPVHPFLVHVYWDLSEADFRKARRGRRKGRRTPAFLRFHDVTESEHDRAGGEASFDVDVELEAMNWYVHIWKPHRSYAVELCLRGTRGRSTAIARSNGVKVPPAKPSDKTDQTYLLVQGVYERVEALHRGDPDHGQSTPGAAGQERDEPQLTVTAVPPDDPFGLAEADRWFTGETDLAWEGTKRKPDTGRPAGVAADEGEAIPCGVSSPFPGSGKTSAP